MISGLGYGFPLSVVFHSYAKVYEFYATAINWAEEPIGTVVKYVNSKDSSSSYGRNRISEVPFDLSPAASICTIDLHTIQQTLSSNQDQFLDDIEPLKLLSDGSIENTTLCLTRIDSGECSHLPRSCWEKRDFWQVNSIPESSYLFSVELRVMDRMERIRL
jgi:hypothetical protein